MAITLPPLLGGSLDGGDPIGPLTGITDINGNPVLATGPTKASSVRTLAPSRPGRLSAPEPDDCTYPVTSDPAKPPASTTAKTASFTLGTDKNPGTFLCSLDGGPESDWWLHLRDPDPQRRRSQPVRSRKGTSSETSTSRPRPTPGRSRTSRSGTLRDQLRRQDRPEGDRVKAPKQTRAATVKVRFKSNEKGSTFVPPEQGQVEELQVTLKTPGSARERTRCRSGRLTRPATGRRSTRVIRKVSEGEKRR